MYKRFLMASITSMLGGIVFNAWAMDELDRFNGMQLAFVVVGPDGTAENRKSAKSKTTPKAAPKAAPRKVAPVTAPKLAPVKVVPPPAPAVVPVPKAVQPVPVQAVKPVAPASIPEPVPVVKPVGVNGPAAKKIESRPSRRASGRTVRTKWQLGLGAEVGGDELGTVTYSDGSTAPVKANTGFAINFGALIPNDDEGNLLTQLSAGYKSGGPRMWNADVNWSAIPLEAIEFYRTGGIRMGLGVSYQLNPQLKVNTTNATSSTRYNNALGFIAQVGWQPAHSGYSIDLRYTRISFQPTDGTPEVSGNVAGMFVNFLF